MTNMDAKKFGLSFWMFGGCLCWIAEVCLAASVTMEQDLSELRPDETPIFVAMPASELPPYFIYKRSTGIEQEILIRSFTRNGYAAYFYPVRDRTAKLFDPRFGFDCVTTVNEYTEGLQEKEGFFSDTVVEYQDVAISLVSHLQDKGYSITRPEDLGDKIVEAYPGARDYLGIRHIVEDNLRYHEHSGKASQILLLYRGRIDVLIMEERMFYYFRERVAGLVDIEKEISIARLFSPVRYKVFCKESLFRDHFDEGLAELRASGEYDDIVAHFLKLAPKLPPRPELPMAETAKKKRSKPIAK